MVAAGTSPNVTYEKEAARTPSSSTRRRSSSSRTAVERTAGRCRAARAGCVRILHVLRARTAGSSVTTATIIRATPATSSRRWRRRRTDIRRSWSCSRTNWRSSMRPRRRSGISRGARSVDAARRGVHGARRGGHSPHADDRRSDREGAGGGAPFPSRSVLPTAELRVACAHA